MAHRSILYKKRKSPESIDFLEEIYEELNSLNLTNQFLTEKLSEILRNVYTIPN